MTLRGQTSWNEARRVSATLSITLLPTPVNFRERPRADRLPSLSSRALPLFTDASRPIDFLALFNSTPTTIRCTSFNPKYIVLFGDYVLSIAAYTSFSMENSFWRKCSSILGNRIYSKLFATRSCLFPWNRSEDYKGAEGRERGLGIDRSHSKAKLVGAVFRFHLANRRPTGYSVDDASQIRQRSLKEE